MVYAKSEREACRLARLRRVTVEQAVSAAKRREIAESVLSGRKTGAEMASLYDINQPTVSRIVAAHRAARMADRP